MRKNQKHSRQKVGKVGQRILLMLLGGLTLSMTRSPKQYWRVIGIIKEDWKEINRQSLEASVAKLYRAKLVAARKDKKGNITMILSNKGKKIALTYDARTMEIPKPPHWDEEWHLVMFDIPEKINKVRDAFRFHLKKIGFIELQHSVFIHPYPCEKEIKFLAELHNIRKYVRIVIAHTVDGAPDLASRFGLV